jgi:phytoene/squalene synthetase
VVKRLLYDLFEDIADDYEKRHVPLSLTDQEERQRNLQQQYAEIIDRNLVDDLSNEIVEEMLEAMRQEMLKESAEEVSKLHDYAHQKTE